MSEEKTLKNKVSASTRYKGEVLIKIMDGKKVISSRKVKNSGKLPLFLFFAQCLTGNYDIAENNRPRYIQLYHVDSTVADEDLFKSSTVWDERCQLVPLSTSPIIGTSTGDEPESASGTFKFVIAFSMISDKEDINFLVLKSMSNSSQEKTVNAYIRLSESLIPQELQSKQKYNLFIEWKLSILDQAVVIQYKEKE